MSNNRRLQGASVILSLVFLLLQAGRSHGQTPASSQETPTVPEILDKCREFFSTWKSVQLTSEADLMFFDDKNNAWKTTGYSQSKEAWDDIRWYSLDQEINRPVDFQHLLHAGFGEEVTVGDNVLGVSFEGRVPTPEEYDSRDFSLFDEPGTDFSVTFYDGAAGSKRRNAGKPSIQFPGGIHILDELSRGIHECKIEAVTMLDRPCWQISSDRASEMRLITVCPDLNYAPVEVRSILGVDFIDSKGKRLGDLRKEGNRKQSSESIKTVVAINQDWSEFTIHSTGLATYQDGSRVGIGRVERYRDIQRPATDAAFQIQTPIKEGTPVVLEDNQQIKAEWHDGKVVRMYDGTAVKELASVEMKPARFGVGRMLSIAGPIAIVVGVGYWGWKRRKTRTNDVGSRARR